MYPHLSSPRACIWSICVAVFFEWYLRNCRFLFFAAIAVFVLHTLTFSFVPPVHSLIEALKLTAALQMTLESPRGLDYSHSTHCLAIVDQALAWLVCGFGWLLVPLTVGAFISEALEIRTAEQELELAFLQAGQEAGKKDDELDEYVRSNMEAIRRIRRGLRRKR
jgi:hypothetical protein